MCRKLIYLTSFILLMFAVPLVTHAQVENLVLNPSFEEDEPILDDPDWYLWCSWNPAEGAGSNATIVDTESIDGARSLRIEPKGVENWYFIVLYLSFPADLDKNYTTSFWAKAEAPRTLTVQMKAADNSINEWGTTDFELTTEWTEYTYTSEVLIADVKLEFLCAGSEVPFWLDLVSVYEVDTLSGLADVTVVDDAIVSIQHEGTEYVVADGDLALGTTTRWYIDAGVETLWAEGDPAPTATVSGTSNPKDGDVGSKTDNFLFTLDGSTNISSIDGIDFQETIFPFLTDTFFLFERGGNDVGTWQAIHADGSLGAAVAFDKASAGGPYADTGINVNGQNAYGVVFKTSVPVQGVRITASGHDTLSISTPVEVIPVPGEIVNILTNGGFEDGVLEPWGFWGDATAEVVTELVGAAVPEAPIEGDSCLHITVNSAGANDWDYGLNQGGYVFEAGKKYTLSAFLKCKEGTLDIRFKPELAADPWSGYGDQVFTMTEEWTEFSVTTPVFAEDTSPGSITFHIAFAAGDFWIDGVRFYEGDYVPPPVTITVEAGGDIAAANEITKPGDTIEIAEGTFYLTSQIEIKDGVTYKGAGPGLTIIDGNDTTRAFVAWGDRSFNNGNENPNDSGPKGWVLEGMTIQNCVADTNDRFSYAGAAFDMLDVFADNDADASGGLSPEEADADAGAIRLPGEDGVEGTEDDDLHRFAHIDTDGSGELSEAELDAQILLQEDEFGDESGDGGAIFIGNQAVGTIQNCDFLNNHTPIAGDGDDGGAVNIAGLSVVTINDCLFNGNYACSPTGVSESDETGDADGDAGHIKVQGASASAITPGTTLIANRCVFLNGNAEDDGGAIQSSAVGSIIRLDACWFEGNTSWDNGNVLMIGNESSHELTVTNCIFVNNITKADNSPDRMCEVRRNSKFINCTFVGNNQEDQDLIYNNANAADTDADGVDDELADATQVINCIFANNVVGNGDDVLGSRDDNFTIAATNCLFFGNTLQNGNAADNTQRPDVETGSILSDPLLDADYVPTEGSEAIDGGVDPATVGVTLTTDYNGDARPQGAAYDIGAYEIPSFLNVPKTSVAPIIDGQWDAVWNDVDETRCLITDMINTDSAPPEDSNDLSAIFKAFYDDNNFYIFVEVQDSVIDYEFSDYNGDGVEIYFDGDNSKGDSYDGINDNQIRITVDDVELADIDSSLPVDGAAFKVLLTDLGYNVEASFPLAKLQVSPDTIIGFEVQINDNDSAGGRETLMRWYSDDNDSWQNPSLFGVAQLVSRVVGQ